MVLATFTLSLLPINTLVADNGNGNGPKTVDLLAGQDMKVGEVTTWNDDDYIYVKYELDEDAIDEGWCITETHVHVGKDLEDFPLNRGGNPQIGHFDYKEKHDPCVKEYKYEILLDDHGWEAGDDLLIAAHAVVETQISKATIYGVTQNGEIYAIDMLTGIEVQITDELNNEGGSSWPNGLALDQENGRLYYADGSSRDQIYFYDLEDDSNHFAGEAGGVVAGAEFADGAYWYIVNGTYEFRKMTFDADGKDGTDEDVTELGTRHNLGDLAVNFSETILYGHSNTSRGDAFFSIDLNDDFKYTEIKQPAGKNLQIAFGSDGILYGVTTGTKNWYSIDLEDGTRTLIRDAENSYTDLANGFEFKTEKETAWAATEAGKNRFTERGNWATYFEYTVMEEKPETCSIEKYTLDIDSVNGNRGFTHEFVLYYNLDLDYIYGTGDGHEGTQTLSEFNYTTDDDNAITYIKFRSDYDAKAYFWFPSFNLLESGVLEYVNIEGDNVNDATGSWESECVAYNLLEVVMVPSENADGVDTNSELEKNQLYLLFASGTYTYNNAGDWADAEWYLKDGEVVKGDTEGSVSHVLDVSIRNYPTDSNPNMD